MHKIILSFTLFLIINTNILFAQNYNSIQVNGGVIIPMSSSKGLTTSIQYNYYLNHKIQFYIYSGYSSWDKFKVRYIEDYSSIQKRTLFSTYSSDEHNLIPVFIGSKINFHSNTLFTPFTTFEIGFSHLSYYSYKIERVVNSKSGAVISYEPDLNTKQKINENLFGIGAGLGLSHQLTEYLNLVFSFKLNSNFNSRYYKFLSSEGTYTAFILGVNFDI